jgi:CHAD domain-containing protein
MPYRVKRKENTGKGMRRIVREQINRARDELAQESPASGETVHQVRKRIKKLRALVRLLEPRLGHGTYRQWNRRLRNLGHALAGSRDADVMLQTLGGLERELRDSGTDIDLSGVRVALLASQSRQESADSDRATPPDRAVAAELAGLRADLRDWSLTQSGFAVAGPGFRKIYKRGRKAMRQARKRPGDRQFHDWRKRVKDHWYHCRLLKYLWPEPMRTRADELKSLSELLGDDHDLAVFRQTLKTLPATTLSPSESGVLHAAIRNRQRTLRAAALKLGLRVYAEKPARIHKRFHRYAQAART